MVFRSWAPPITNCFGRSLIAEGIQNAAGKADIPAILTRSSNQTPLEIPFQETLGNANVNVFPRQ
jgi:hypothetical protein